MITCPQCQCAGAWQTLHKSPINPAEDRFQCLKCGAKFTRYDNDNRGAIAVKELPIDWVCLVCGMAVHERLTCELPRDSDRCSHEWERAE